MKQALTVLAGKKALARIERDGFKAEDVTLMVGASGGARCLVLNQLDRLLFGRLLKNRSTPLHLLGSSIGSWRFACGAQADPAAAFERLGVAYSGWRSRPGAGPRQFSNDSLAILKVMMSGNGVAEVLAHPRFRLHIVTVRSRRVTAFEQPVLLGAGLLLALASNAVSRKSLGLFFERVLFSDQRDKAPFGEISDIPSCSVPLDQSNFMKALLASGSIPMIMDAVEDISGAPPGLYRDGGVTDYHFDMSFVQTDGLIFYPHYYPFLVPGWFDKKLWRRVSGQQLDNLLLVTPSPEFVENLPFGKIPDRTDFTTMDDAQRLPYWRRVVAEGERLADEFQHLVEKDLVADRLVPLADE
jgi:hypothetical protein